MTRLHTIAATLGLLVAVPAFAVDADAPVSVVSVHEQLMAQIRELQNRPQQAQWVNRWVPAATGMVDSSESADSRLRSIVAGLDRAALDRGGWANRWVAGGHYAAGEPQVPVAVGAGITSGGSAPLDLNPRLAAR